MSADALIPGKSYLFKQSTLSTLGQIDTLRLPSRCEYLHRSPTAELQLNEIGRCSITVNQPMFFDPYRRNKTTGSFIIIDRISNITVGAGMITDRDTARTIKQAAWENTEEESTESTGEFVAVTEAERSARFGQNPATVLLTGLTVPASRRLPKRSNVNYSITAER